MCCVCVCAHECAHVGECARVMYGPIIIVFTAADASNTSLPNCTLLLVERWVPDHETAQVRRRGHSWKGRAKASARFPSQGLFLWVRHVLGVPFWAMPYCQLP